MTSNETKDKFKSLKDSYRKIVQSEQHASGSAQILPKEQWKHYKSMEFLRDSCLIRTTATNVEHETVERQQVEEADDFTGDCDDANSTVSDIDYSIMHANTNLSATKIVLVRAHRMDRT